jgi:hypothetical protein
VVALLAVAIRRATWRGACPESRKLHPEGKDLVSAGERDDYLALASHLIEVLKGSPPEAGFARREAQ